MNRDNLLFTVIGLLTGFIAGYVMHEVMAARQPPRRSTAQIAQGASVPLSSSAEATTGAPAMEQVQRLRRHVEENPDDADAIRLLANLNYDIQSWDRAVELYRRYLELRPEDPDVLTDLGASYRHLARPREALEQFRRARALEPDYWQARYNEILVLSFDLGDLAAARSAMQELLALEPENPDVKRLAAEIDRRLKET